MAIRLVFLGVALLLGQGCNLFAGSFPAVYDTHLAPAGDPVAPVAVTGTADPGPAGIWLLWFGTNSFHITDGQTSILFDPFVSRYGLLHVGLRQSMTPDADLQRQWLDRLQGPAPSHIFVSHSHFDHALDAPGFARALSATIVGSVSTRNIAIGHGVPRQQTMLFEYGQTVTVGAFQVRAVPAVHGRPILGFEPYPGTIEQPVPVDAPANAYRTGQPYSYVVEHPLLTMILHGYGDVPQGPYAGLDADVLLLTIAGRRDYDAFLGELLQEFTVHTIVPTHIDNFFKPLSEPLVPGFTVDLEGFFDAVAARPEGLKLQTLPVGEYVRLERIRQ